MRVGKSRREALKELAARTGVDDLSTFVTSIIQADQLGVSITQVLRIQAAQLRQRRRQRAEEQAHKAPIKMLFPMVFLIFPAIYVIILGPAVPQVLKSLGSQIAGPSSPPVGGRRGRTVGDMGRPHGNLAR